MAVMLVEAIRLLLNDTVVSGVTVFQSDLSTYVFGTGVNSPSIHTGRIVPDDAQCPLVLIKERPGNQWDTLGHVGEELSADVIIQGDKDTNIDTLRSLAWQAKEILHHADISEYLDTRNDHGVWAESPQTYTDGRGFPGFSIPVKALMLSSS